MSTMSHDVETIADPLVYREQAAFKDTYGGAEGMVVLERHNVCLPSPATSMYDAVPHTDEQLHRVDGANHDDLGEGRAPKLAEAVGVVDAWLEDHALA